MVLAEQQLNIIASLQQIPRQTTIFETVIMTRFVDRFWDTDFNSTNGYEVLLKRMKEGREMCKDYEEFLKQRSKAEEVFGKTLLKISKGSGGKDEIGNLKTSWDEMLTQTESSGSSHISIANKLAEEAKKLEEFRETQKERRRKSEETIKKVNTLKRDQYSKVMHSKRSYENRCKELDVAQDSCTKGRQQEGTQKEIDKATVKRERAHTAFTNADSQYQRDVYTLEQTRQQWEEQMATVCVIFEQLEKDRICFLRNVMWVFTNIVSLQCCSDDENYDAMRNVISDCNEDNDVELFVSLKATGTVKPAPVIYECYYKDDNPAPLTGSVSNGRKNPSLPPVPRADQSRALPPPPQPSPGLKNEGAYSSMGDPNYSMGIVADGKPTNPLLYVANFDYEAQGKSELTMVSGDVATIVNKEDHTWWYVSINGHKGHVPANYLGPYKDAAEAGQMTAL